MKQWMTPIILALLFAFTACSTPKQSAQADMTIQPSALSDETKQVLALLDEDLAFFDFTVNEAVKSSTIHVWIYKDGAWVDEGAISGNIEQSDNQIAIQVTESEYSIFAIDKSGFTQYSNDADNSFEHTSQQLSNKISHPTAIVVGEEIVLWVKIGNSDDKISLPDDFRSANCTAGIAVTVTFSNEPVQ